MIKRNLLLILFLAIITIFSACKNKDESSASTSEEKESSCNCFENNSTNSFIGTYISLKDKILSVHCATVVKKKISDELGDEIEKYEYECISKEAKNYSITNGTKYILYDKNGNKLDEDKSKDLFFELLKIKPSAAYKIILDAQKNILEISSYPVPEKKEVESSDN